jgi:hypothetical protein
MEHPDGAADTASRDIHSTTNSLVITSIYMPNSFDPKLWPSPGHDTITTNIFIIQKHQFANLPL